MIATTTLGRGTDRMVRPDLADGVPGHDEDDRRDDDGHDDGQRRRGKAHQDPAQVETGGSSSGRSVRRGCPGHGCSELFRVTVSGSKSPERRPRRMTRIVSDRPISSSRSAEMSRTASPLRLARLSWSQIAAWAPTSTPRVGVGGHHHLGLAPHLPADDELLLVAARQRAGGDVDRGGADVVLLDDLLGLRPCGAGVDQRAPARSRRSARSGGRG